MKHKVKQGSSAEKHKLQSAVKIVTSSVQSWSLKGSLRTFLHVLVRGFEVLGLVLKIHILGLMYISLMNTNITAP